MNSNRLIEYDVVLLLLRHGQSTVLKQLAHLMSESEEQLEQRLSGIRLAERKPKSAKSSGKTVSFSVERLANTHPMIADRLLELEAKYENRTFLIELRDVKRFLERNGNPVPKLKSRKEGKKKVFETLASLTRPDLDRLREDEDRVKGVSSLGVISDQILSRSKKS